MEKKADGTTWFSEYGELWPGQAMSLQIEEVLEDTRTEYQHLVMAQTSTYGKMMVLDGCIQVTDRDEMSYHEMIANLPMFTHANPEKVLIIGGGDGGALAQVLRHPGVTSAVLCDIDAEVTAASKRHFPKLAGAFADPRVTVLHADGAKYVSANPDTFDVVIVDSSDPIGPAETLFSSEFFTAVFGSLRAGGVLATQGECPWLHLGIITRVLESVASVYARVGYAWTSVPTYPSGAIGFVLAEKGRSDTPASESGNEDTREEKDSEGGVEVIGPAIRGRSDAELAAFEDGCEYWSREVHAAAFALPAFAARKIRAAIAKGASARKSD